MVYKEIMIIELSLNDIENFIKTKMQLGVDTYYHWKLDEIDLNKNINENQNQIILEIETYNYF